jgi:hypothetical protein
VCVSAAQLADAPPPPAGVPVLQAEALFLIARSMHDKGDFAGAGKHYSEALDRQAAFQLARFGDAQVSLHRGDIDAAYRTMQVRRVP